MYLGVSKIQKNWTLCFKATLPEKVLVTEKYWTDCMKMLTYCLKINLPYFFALWIQYVCLLNQILKFNWNYSRELRQLSSLLTDRSWLWGVMCKSGCSLGTSAIMVGTATVLTTPKVGSNDPTSLFTVTGPRPSTWNDFFTKNFYLRQFSSSSDILA